MSIPKFPIRTGSRWLRAAGAAAALLLALPLSGTAFAQSAPKTLGSFGDWHAFELQQGKSRTCYIVARPKSEAPKGIKRSDPYILVSDTPAQKVDHQFSINFGYDIKKDSAPDLTIGSDHFPLVVFEKPGYEKTGWAKDNAGDNAIASAMEKGESLTAKAVSARGTATTDTYSLSGVSAALKAIAGACK